MKKKTLLNLFVSAVLVMMGNVSFGQANDANLASLTTSSGALSPAFAPATLTGYTAPGILYADAFTVTPTVEDIAGLATVQISLDNATWSSATNAVAKSVTLAVGSNTVYVKVTSSDLSTTQTYQFTVTRAAAATNANLSALTISAGTLAPVFASGTTAYTASVAYATSSITETPTVADATATIQIRVNGGGWAPVTSGSASGSLALSVGTNTIDVKVTAQDGVTTKTYTTAVTRQSYDAKLSALTTSSGALTPVFAPTTYTGYAAPGILYADVFTVTPTVEESHATVQISLDNATWSPATSGSVNTVALAVGTNDVYVLVTAQDPTYTHTYHFTVVRAPKSNDATLSNLVATTATFSSPFASGTIDYQSTVPYATSSITVTPTVHNIYATVQVRINNGVTTTVYATVASGSPSVALNLSVGDNMIDVNVTAQDGVTSIDYRIKVTRGFPSSNADLLSLTTSIDPLNAAFASATTSYNKIVINATSSMTVTPTVADATATIKVRINGGGWASLASGVTSGSLALNVGNNTVEIQVTAQDGSTVKTYTIAVLRVSTIADLSSLTINHGTLTPVFGLATLSYTVTVDNSVTTVAVTPTVALGGTIAVDLNGGASAAVTSGTASGNLAVTVAGPNVIHVVITNGIVITTYTVTITRLPSSDATLSGLEIDAGTLAPAFDGAIIDYSATVANAVSVIHVKPHYHHTNQTVKTSINYGTEQTVADGTWCTDLSLNEGDNMIHNVVTAEDGTTKINYRIKITRTPSWGGGGGGIGGGGLESKSLGDAIVKRILTKAQNNLNGSVDYSKLSVVKPRTAVVSTTGVTTFGLGGSISSVQLADIMPDISSVGFVAYNSSPADLTAITNAKQVLATDFTLNNQPQAVAFATMTLGELYDHTKPICDRLKGAALMDVKNMNVGGYNFVQYTLLNE
ncbi:MAG TPA: cadherin-like beta sandwich domain-containing protein, partial [Chitinophagaceae bacterium]|nr:cadherin-like beta sandwich domain-containing protein [Chitinophagaceae bacterium]